MRMKNLGVRGGGVWCGLGGAMMLLLLVVLGILTKLELVYGQEALEDGDTSACLYDSDCKGQLCCLYHHRSTYHPIPDYRHFAYTTCGNCSVEKGRNKGSKEKPTGPAKYCRKDSDCGQSPLCCIVGEATERAEIFNELGQCIDCTKYGTDEWRDGPRSELED